ncbi:MAG: heavy metal translocating P-type ATPase [Polyangiaceae bacterium]|jgi:Cd2+/Zn2+-exporting ATPase|nr:heavy metal translocating P-type ATPase [Polyangiaceae bacterium]
MKTCTSKGCGCADQSNPLRTGPKLAGRLPMARLAPPPLPQVRSGSPQGAIRTVLFIKEMDCPTEEALIRRKLLAVPGVIGLEFHLMQRTLVVQHATEALSSVVLAIASLGFEAVPADGTTGGRGRAVVAEAGSFWRRGLVVSGVAAVAAEGASWWCGDSHLAVVALALLAVAAGGLPTYKKGWVAAKNLNLTMNALMSLAVTGAMLVGAWPEAAMVMFLFALAEVIDARSLQRARRAISKLMQLAPERVTVRDHTGAWHDVDAKAVHPGALARVRPGERIALDGEVVRGRSSVNQAPITGESLALDKGPGDVVYAGSINEQGAFEYQVTAAASDSTLARILRAVEEAQGRKAPVQRFVDRFARVYTPMVLVVAAGVALVPPLAWGGSWLQWAYRALVLLVIACPCALVISTPVTIVSALATAARQGILIKGGAFLEQGRRLTTLAFDKTGTLTEGHPELKAIEALGDLSGGALWTLVATLSVQTHHPVSRAILRAALAAGATPDEVDEVEAVAGRGVRAKIGGQWYTLGNLRMLVEAGLCDPGLEAKVEARERNGQSVVVLANETCALALLAVADKVKASSRHAIAQLHAIGIRTLMLSGDNRQAALTIGEQVGIDEVCAGLLPNDKLRLVESMLGPRAVVGMVGDGINDAPALARADIGFVMGAAGTDTAMETADVAIMDDDLRRIEQFVRLSKRTASVLAQNIALAIGIKVVFFALALMGQASMWMAVFADMGVSLMVVANGLRLLRAF